MHTDHMRYTYQALQHWFRTTIGVDLHCRLCSVQCWRYCYTRWICVATDTTYTQTVTAAASASSTSEVMGKPNLRRQVQGSLLVDSIPKLQALAGLLEQPVNSLNLNTLFSTQASGWNSPAAFHSTCDNKGPTLVLVKASDGSSFGGYTSTSWTSTGAYQHDAKAFLFRFSHFAGTATGLVPQKFTQTQHGYSIHNNPQCGPTFGGGNDLMTFNTSGIQLTCHPHSYNSSGPLVSTSLPKQAYNFHLEVLQVSTTPANMTAELEEPWMGGCSWTAKVEHCAPLAL